MTADTVAETTDREAPDVPTPFRAVPPLPEGATAEEQAAILDQAGFHGLAASIRAGADPAAQVAPPSENERDCAYLAELRFPAENQRPQWDGLPEEWRGPLRAYTAQLRGYVATGQGVYLCGAVGRGKTSALAMIARAARRHEVTCEYVLNGEELLWQCGLVDSRAKTRATSFDAIGEDLNMHKQWPHMDVRLLLLDDLDYIPGVGYAPEREGWDTIGRFLYARMARGLATCIAANVTLEAVGDQRGLLSKPELQRVASRWQRAMPEELRMIATRGDMRGSDSTRGEGRKGE